MTHPVLSLRNVCVGTENATIARRITFDIRAGEIWVLVGQNGSGKTLLLETVAGLRPPRDGEVRLGGKPLARWAPREAAVMRAYLPQSVVEPEGVSVLDLAMLGRHPYLPRWAWEGCDEIRMAMDALEMVGMADLRDREVASLSGGERQRSAIAALVVQDAPLLVLDEPFAHLDVHHRVAVFERLASLAHAKRKAVLLSLHDLDLAARFATHALLYRGDGEVTAGPAREVLTTDAVSRAFMHPIVRAFVAERAVFVCQ